MTDPTNFDIFPIGLQSASEDGKCDSDLENRLYGEIYHSKEALSDATVPNITPESTCAHQPVNNLQNTPFRWSANARSNHVVNDLATPSSPMLNETLPPQPPPQLPPPLMSVQIPATVEKQRQKLQAKRKNREKKRRQEQKARKRFHEELSRYTKLQNLSKFAEKASTNVDKNVQETLEPNSADQSTANPSPDTANHNKNMSPSKYEVVAKCKSQEVEQDPESESSDSDDSIQEVPVPPKPPPLLLTLRDSDESSSSDDEDSSPVVMPEKPVEKSPAAPVGAICEDSNSSSIVTVASSRSGDTNLMINCTPIQRGASSLEEIKRAAASTSQAVVHDESSMTESEAMNWDRIEVQSNTEKRTNDTGGTTIDKELWNHLNNDENTLTTTEERCEPPVNVDPPATQENIPLTGQENNPLTGQANNEVTDDVPRARKRSRNADVDANKGESSEGAQKRLKTAVKATADMSFQEYVFQPMSQTVADYYNTPRPDDCKMTVHQLQRQMSSDPKNWKILNADHNGQFKRTPDRRKRCASCHQLGHLRNDCPQSKHEPACHMCGKVGHLEPRCPQSMCLTCGTPFSAYRKTCEICKPLKCATCKGAGHNKDNCPDLWRRYHHTTHGIKEEGPSEPQVFQIPVLIGQQTQPHNSVTPKVEKKPEIPTPYSLNGQILFHCKSQDIPTPFLYTYTIDIANIRGAHLAGIRAGTVFPAVIAELEGLCAFELIIGYDNGSLQMLLRGQDKEIMNYLQLLLEMWVKRSDEEKWLMISAATLPLARTPLMKVLKARHVLSQTMWSTDDQNCMDDHLEEIRRLSELVKDTSATFQGDARSKIEESLKEVQQGLSDLKWKVVLCMYHCLWVPNAREKLNEFHISIKNLKNYIHEIDVPITMYLKILNFCNEVFVPHTSEHIISAARKCIETMKNRRIREVVQNIKLPAEVPAVKQEVRVPTNPPSEQSVVSVVTPVFDGNISNEIEKMNDTLRRITSHCCQCKKMSFVDEKVTRKKYWTIHNFLSQLIDNEVYIKRLEQCRHYVVRRVTLPTHKFIKTLDDICNMLRTNIATLKACKQAENSNQVPKATPGCNKDTSTGDEINQVPDVKPKVEAIAVDNDKEVPATSQVPENNPNHVKIETPIVKIETPIVKIEAPSVKIETRENSVTQSAIVPENDETDDDNLLNHLEVLEDLLNDPVFRDGF